MLINAFIIGAQKCASTSLLRYMAQHPDIYSAAQKGDPAIEQFRTGSAAGAPGPAAGGDAYAGQKTIIQKTPRWLYMPEMAEKFFAYNPEARLIAIVRNQADRAFSHWRHNIGRGREILPFEEALAHEPARLRKGGYFNMHFSYLDRGWYGRQLARYREFFPGERMLAVSYERFTADPAAVCAEIFSFLGVEPSFAVNPAEKHNSNEYEMISPLIGWPFYMLNHVPGVAGKRFDRVLQAVHVRFNSRPAAERPKIAPDTKARIMAQFADENAALYADWNVRIE